MAKHKYDEYGDIVEERAEPVLPQTAAQSLADKAVQTGTEVKKQYAPNVDYAQKINESAKAGNYAAAKEYEQARNMKIAEENLNYAPTNVFNYDGQRYENEKNRVMGQIENREKFSYNAEGDEAFNAIKRQKEAEADKAYKDAYARLAAQNGGEVPADMMMALENIRQNIIDSADSYIPQLQQMAYNKYSDELGELYNRYGLIENRDNADYNRFYNERNNLISGLENAYNRDYNERSFAASREDAAWNKEFNERSYQDSRDDVMYNREFNKNQFDWQKDSTIAGTIAALIGSGYGEAEAIDMARRWYGQSDGASAQGLQNVQNAQAVKSNSVKASGRSGNSGSVYPRDEAESKYTPITSEINGVSYVNVQGKGKMTYNQVKKGIDDGSIEIHQKDDGSYLLIAKK